MRVIVDTWLGEEETDLDTAVARRLNGSDYDRGQVEAAAAEARNAVEFLGRLVNVLADKKILTEEDLTALLRTSVRIV